MKTNADNRMYPVPKPVYDVLDRLCSSGYEAYLVGGCVRDLLLGQVPHDFDITTSAPPQAIQHLFEGRVLSTAGLRFGTVGVRTARGLVEITTYRGEEGYSDARHPDRVRFGVTLEDDLVRRDFLMNAVCMTKDGRVVDPLGGRADIRRGLITACGDADARFREDALRVLRGVRFACRLGFQIAPATLAAMKRAAGALSSLPMERVSAELCGILCSPDPARLFSEFSWCLHALFPRFAPAGTAGLNRLPASLALRLLPLSPLEGSLLLPRQERARLVRLRQVWDRLPVPDGRAARQLLCLQEPAVVREALHCYDLVFGTAQSALLSENDALRLSALPCGGQLRDMGFAGREIRLVLDRLRLLALEEDTPPDASWRKRQVRLLSDTGAVLRLMPPTLRDLCGLAPFSDQLLPVRSRARLPEKAESVILFALPYYSAAAGGGNLSKYAAVPDYHLVVPALLQPVADRLKQAFPDHSFQVFTDSSPNREVALAVQAGLGVRGDNGLLLHPAYGSFVFIGEIVTDLPLFFFAQPGGECLHCGQCRAACPVGLDKSRCVSALTQKKGALTEEEQALVRAGGLIWGCDRCQDCCPYNRNLPDTPLVEFKRDVLPRLDRDQVEALVPTRAFGFRGPGPLLRNLALLEQEEPS